MVQSPKMTAARRRRLPASAFGLAETRQYPLDTPGRAANAKARAAQMEERGLLSTAQARRILSVANSKIGLNSGSFEFLRF